MSAVLALASVVFVSSISADISVNGNWVFNDSDGSYRSPAFENIDEFRIHFAGVLRMYSQYEPYADRLAQGIVNVSSLTLHSNGDEFSSIGNEIAFNPLATAGVDIATGGDYIDTQLESQGQTCPSPAQKLRQTYSSKISALSKQIKE